MSDRLYVASRKGLFTLDRQGTKWGITRTAFLGDPVTMVLPNPRDGSVYAALDLGHFGVKLHRSKDEGNTWEEISTPAFPKPQEGEESLDMWGKPIPWKVVKIWALATSDSGTIWCGTIPGGLFVSQDHGTSWELLRSLWDHPARKQWFGGGADLPGIHSVCVDPRNPNQVTIGISCGGVWYTADAGATWECRSKGMWAAYMPPESKDDPNVQDPHCVVQCPADPKFLWAQHHNGVFRSVDQAQNWEEVTDISPSGFGFAVAVHPQDPNTAWFVPAKSDERRLPVDGKVVVTRTRDGGKQFDTLCKGLPQEHAYDLTFRHALDIDDHGDRLAFGSTTGSLWLTEDQGDSWQTLSTHLPPIYCVRFVK